MTTPVIRLQGLTKRYQAFTAVDSLDIEFYDGEYICLLGPSGCGKTTTLRMIAGYVDPTEGQVFLDEKEITYLPVRERNMGMVFQSYALFPHMTVAENIAFPLRVRKQPEAQIRNRVREILELVRLPQVADRKPGQLSGGQQQRIALARALSFRPRILLLDEPLGALDVKLREAMQLELKQIQKQLGVTTIHVTHDQEEALSLADRILVMRDGQIAQFASPTDLYDHPANQYVADFVGKINFLAARVLRREQNKATLAISDTGHTVTVDAAPTGSQEVVTLGLRPEELWCTPSGEGDLQGTIEKTRYVGGEQFCFVRISSELLLMIKDRENQFRVDQQVGVGWKASSLRIFQS